MRVGVAVLALAGWCVNVVWVWIGVFSRIAAGSLFILLNLFVYSCAGYYLCCAAVAGFQLLC